MFEVVDRVPTYPGRVKITKESDGTFEYVTWERADEPTVEGTPINKALFDSIKADIGLSADITVYVATSGSDTLGDGTEANPYATIQKAVDSIPKALNGNHAVIDIAAGTYGERVQIDGFSGGRLSIGVAGRAVTVYGISVWSSSFVRINISNIVYSAAFPGTLLYGGANSEVFVASGLTLQGNGASTVGIGFEQGSVLTTTGTTITINGTTYAAVHANTGAKVVLYRVAGSDNTGSALRADNGGVVTYDLRTLEAPTLFLTDSGGKIYRGAQTNAPEY